MQGYSRKGPMTVLVAVTVLQVMLPTGISGSSIDCNGEHGTVHPDPADCEQFYQCVWGHAVSRACGDDTVFNTALNRCDHEDNVQCEDGVSPSSTATTTPPPTTTTAARSSVDCNGEHGTVHPHPYECNIFYLCVWGHAVSRACDDGTVFNTALNRCDDEDNVQCEDGVRPSSTATTTPPPTTTAAARTLFDCKGEQGTFHADPDDCGKFYLCVWGKAVSMNCPSKLVFNVVLNVCDWEHNVICEDGVRPFPPCVGFHQFQCDDGKCIPFAGRCNGTSECRGSVDEQNCDCPAGRVLCADGSECVREDFWCDTFYDCADRSDEQNCTVGCTGYHKFKCDGKCHYVTQQCDGHPDCSDRSDEDPAMCNGCAFPGAFNCGDGQCIQEYRVCDTVNDCANGKDELQEYCQM